MWCLLFVVCSLFPSLICKEYASNLDVGDDKMNLIYNIAKRLEKNSESSPKHDRVPIDTVRHHPYPDGDTDKKSEGECNVIVNDGIIIRTEDSIQNGAYFLGLNRDAVSQGACADHCCKKPSCDTAVFEKKGEHKCYLFSCQERCHFSHHGNFSSSAIERPMRSPPSSSTTADHNEPDMDENSSGAVTSSTPSTTSTTTTTVLPHSGERCPVGKFECQTSVNGSRQCISQEEVCDSITQCADGSDERNCSHTGAFPTNSWDSRLPPPELSTSLPDTHTLIPQEQKTLLPLVRSSQLPGQKEPLLHHRLLSAVGAVSAGHKIMPETSAGHGRLQTALSESRHVQNGYGQGDPSVYPSVLSGQLQSLPDSLKAGWYQSDEAKNVTVSVKLSSVDSQQPGKDVRDTFSEDLRSSRGPTELRTDEQQPKEESLENYPTDAEDISNMYPQYSDEEQSEEFYSDYPGEHLEIAEDSHGYPADVKEESEYMYQKYPSDLQKPLLKIHKNHPSRQLSMEHDPSELQRKDVQLQSGYSKQQLPLSQQRNQFAGSGGRSEPFDRAAFYDSENNFQSQHSYQSPEFHPQDSHSKPMLKSLSDEMHQSKQDSNLLNSKRGSSGAPVQPLTHEKQNEGSIENEDADYGQHIHLAVQQGLISSSSKRNSGPQAPSRLPVTSVLYSIHGKSGAGQESDGANPEDQAVADVATVGMNINKPSLATRQYSSMYAGHDFSSANAGYIPKQLNEPQGDQPQNWNGHHHSVSATSSPLNSPVTVNSTGIYGSFPVGEESSGHSESRKVFRQQLGLGSNQPDIQSANSERDDDTEGSDQLFPGQEDLGVYQEGFKNSDLQSYQYREGKMESLHNPGMDQYAQSQETSALVPESQSSDGQLSSQGGSPSNSSTGDLHNGKEHHTQGDKQGSDHDYQDAYHDFWEDENKTQSVKDQQTEGKLKEDKNNEDKQNQHSSQDQNLSGSEEKQDDKQQAGNKTSSEKVTPEQHSPTTRPEQPKMDTTEPTADRTTPTRVSTTSITSPISTSADGSFVSKKKVGESVEVDNLQVPIIALSVGLAFTLILLVFVTCRLCTVRRRLRKGRPLHSNEADYLINGMYL